MATRFPARCEACQKLTYVSGMFSGSDSDPSFITGCSMTFVGACSCGGDLTVLQGDYKYGTDKADLLSGPASSWEALKELAQVVRDSVAAGESPEKTVERAAEFLPWLKSWKGALAIQAVGLLINWAGSKALDKIFDSPPPEPPAITLQQLKDAFREELEKAKQDGLLIQPPPPAPASRPSPGVQRHPMLVKFPITAQKLANYEKESGKVNQFTRRLA